MADKLRPEKGKEKVKLQLARSLIGGVALNQVRKFPARPPGGILGGRENKICFKVYKATRWTIRHGLMLL